jgi:hypothetical protein
MGGIGLPELLILLVLLALLIIPIWAIIDAAARPDSQWAAAGQSKVRWLVFLTVGSFLPVIGLVLLIVYLASIRPQLQRAAG